jgi:hypothetical protein
VLFITPKKAFLNDESVLMTKINAQMLFATMRYMSQGQLVRV